MSTRAFLKAAALATLLATIAPRLVAAEPSVPRTNFASLYSLDAIKAYELGKYDARTDLTNGVIGRKAYGLPVVWASQYDKLLEQRCQMKTDWVAGCIVSQGLTEYARGYNEISFAHVKARHGTNIFDDLAKQVEAAYLHPPAAATNQTYIVRAGDSLAKIARAHGISVGALQSANNVRADRLKIGQVLNIPARQLPSPSNP